MEMQAMAASETKSGKSGSLWRPTEKRRQSTQPKLTIPASALRCRRKFLRFFPGGFADETYVDWERGYKWQAHERWMDALGPSPFRDLLRQRRFADIASHAVSIESRTNLLFSFEKMALRDAVKSAGRRRSVRDRALRVSAWSSGRRATLRAVVRRGGIAAASTDARAHVARRDGVRVHRPTGPPHVPQA